MNTTAIIGGKNGAERLVLTEKKISHSKQTALAYIQAFGGTDKAILYIIGRINHWHEQSRGKSMVLFLNVVKRHVEKIQRANTLKQH
jgi:hypothetical protein